MQAFYNIGAEQALKELSSSPLGLSSGEAEARLRKSGRNALAADKKLAFSGCFYRSSRML